MVWSGQGRVTTGIKYTEGMRGGMIVRGNRVSEARHFKVSIYLFEPGGCWRLSFEMLSQEHGEQWPDFSRSKDAQVVHVVRLSFLVQQVYSQS